MEYQPLSTLGQVVNTTADGGHFSPFRHFVVSNTEEAASGQGYVSASIAIYVRVIIGLPKSVLKSARRQPQPHHLQQQRSLVVLHCT